MGDTSDIAVGGSGGEKRRLIVNTVVNGASQFASMLASLVFMPMLVKAFGITNYGLFMLASSVAAYSTLLDLGVGTALTKWVAQYRAADDRQSSDAIIATGTLFFLFAGLVVAAGIFAVGQFSEVLFKVDGAGGQNLRYMLWLTAAFQVWMWPSSTARHVLAGLERYDLLAISAGVASALSIIATLFVVVTGDGPLVLVGLQGVVGVIVSALNIMLVHRTGWVGRLRFGSDAIRWLRVILSFSWAVFVVQVADVLFYQQTDRVLLGVLAGATAVGLYEAAAKFNVLLTYLSGLTVSAVLPMATGMHEQGRHASLRSLFLRGTKYASALVAPSAVVSMMLAGPLIVAWLGPRFADQTIVAQTLLLPHVLVCLGLMGDAIITGKGRLGRRVPYIAGQAVLNVVLSAVLIPHMGTMGVAVGTAVSHLVDFPFHMRFLLSETGVSMRVFFSEVVRTVYPPLVVPILVAVLLMKTSATDSLLGVIATGAGCLFAYWMTLIMTGLSEQEREESRRVMKSVLGALRGGR